MRVIISISLWLGVLALILFGAFFVAILALFSLYNKVIIYTSAIIFIIGYIWLCFNFTCKKPYKKQLQIMLAAVILCIVHMGYIEYHLSIPQVKGELKL